MKIYSTFALLVFVILFSGCSGDFSAIEKGFVSPPDSIRTGVYWYWINDNISKEAVVKDLQAMKKAGINRAFIGNIGQQSYPVGKVKILSEEWWEVMHTALKTATELDIEIGIFNSPGWSQSGGPWIKPEQSMRYLATSELRVKGPAKIEQKLPVPETIYDFQDVKVIAFPVSEDYLQNLFDVPNARIFTMIFSDNKMQMLQKPKSPDKYFVQPGESYIGLTLPKAYTARSLEIYINNHAYANAELQMKNGNEFKTVKKFVINRTNANLNVGFVPYAPIVISLPEVTSSEYRIAFSHTSGFPVRDIILSATPIIERYPEKTLAKMFQSPLPYWHDYLWDKQPDIQPDAVAATLARPEQVLDISKYMSADGTLSWEAPEGEWLILRTGMTSTGVTNSPAPVEGTGLEVDKMSKKHVAAHFDAFLGKILERVPPEDRKTWKLVVEDSYETGGQNFTDDFFDDFKARYGYDALPF
ncbi:MAG: glycoside hydrolase family 2, partial [Prevotellaceae bacterium]|nr:glycoside hydrolase family 2 [Prevotellaceae bacterium]